MTWSEQDTACSIPERFDQLARLRADRLAIAGTSQPLTYAELAELTVRYAGALIDRRDPAPHAPGRAALLLGHDGEVVAAAIAALRCGMAVVTLNAADPPARLAQIRAEVDPDLLITDAAHLDLAGAAGFAPAQTVDLGGIPPATDPGRLPAVGPDQLAFLICTSGSSGRPKVVMQSHRNVLHNVLRYTNGLQIRPDDRIALLASLSGGQGLATTWTALCNGATLCPFPISERGVTGLVGWLAENRVTVFDTIPSVLRNFAQTLRDERIAGVRLVRIASEGALRTDFDAFRRHFPGDCALASVLASSEAGIIAQAILNAGDEPPEGSLAVGAPAEGVQIALRAQDGQPAGNGHGGEIIVEGRYLSPGYWRDEALTAERFETVDGVRRFRTGDLARRSEAGELTVLGRADKQVKVRGHRLQLEEVESAIAAHPDVAGAVVLARARPHGDVRLTGYLVPAPGRTPSAAELRRSLGDRLAQAAIPTAFVFVDAFPLTPHGKIDRERLATLEPAAEPAPVDQRSGSETEELIAGLWAEAFGRQVGAHDAFLDLGGDSLVAAVIAAGVHDALGVELDLRMFVSNPTVATMAALVDQNGRTAGLGELPPLRQVARSGPLSFAQARFWEQGQASGNDAHWNVVVPFRLRGPVEVGALRASIDNVVRRHEILRTTFDDYDGRPMAIVRPPEPVELAVDDLRADDAQDQCIESAVAAELRRQFDRRSGPLLRLRLLRLGDEEYQLLRTSDHLIHDAVSWKIFFDELAAGYEALIEGRPLPLQDKPALQYIDYAVWERAFARPGSHRVQADVAWWQRNLESPPPRLELPFARGVPAAGPAQAGDVFRWGLAAEHSEGLDRIGREAGATFFMTRLAAFASSLAIEAGVDDLVIGTPVSTRTRLELQRMIGPFINVGMLRLRFTGDPSYREWLRAVRRAVIDLSARAAVPWEVVMPELLGRGARLPRVSARFRSWSSVLPMSFGGIEFEPLPRACGESSDFLLGVSRPFEADRCWAEFDPRLHDPAGVEAFISRLQALIAAVCAEPDRSLRDLHSAAALR